MTKDQVLSLDSKTLAAIIASTDPDTEKFALELVWAKDELIRRRTERVRKALAVAA